MYDYKQCSIIQNLYGLQAIKPKCVLQLIVFVNMYYHLLVYKTKGPVNLGSMHPGVMEVSEYLIYNCLNWC